MFYWFDKSTKCKGILKEFYEFSDNEYLEIVRYVSVRWLSLEKTVYRILQLYVSLQSYFRSESESQVRFVHLQSSFDNPMTEVYLLFFIKQSYPLFKLRTCLNLLMQREDPCIFLVADAIRSFLRKILAKFVTIQAIKSKNDITTVAYECIDNQLDDNHITIGITTKIVL